MNLHNLRPGSDVVLAFSETEIRRATYVGVLHDGYRAFFVPYFKQRGVALDDDGIRFLSDFECLKMLRESA